MGGSTPNFSRYWPGVCGRYSLSGVRVVQELKRLIDCAMLDVVVSDNGSELSSVVLRWIPGPQACRYIEPGKPVQKVFIRSLNTRVRNECLEEHLFDVLAEARRMIAA